MVDSTLQKKGADKHIQEVAWLVCIKLYIKSYQRHNNLIIFNDMRIAKITMEFAPVCKCINAKSAIQVNEMYQFGLIKRTAVIVPPTMFKVTV